MTSVRATAIVDVLDVWDDATVGEEFVFTGRARIVAIEEELIDATTLGGPPAMLPGGRTVKLFIMDIAPTRGSPP